MRRLLIVEDDVNWSDILCRYAHEIGAATKVVVSGEQAIDLIDRWRPNALVLDMLLAGETAVALLNELRSHDDLARLPVVVCSNVDLCIDEMRPFGVVALLHKSTMTPLEVKTTLKEAIYESK